ncbi:MAG: signal peptidase I [Patescibacteria group bacterium]|nr:signal peptidase I [Patescibacteria group bacterium]
MNIEIPTNDASRSSVADSGGEKPVKLQVSGKKKGKQGVSFFVELVKTLFLAFLIIIPIRTFVFQPFFVQGSSMKPNFHDGEYLIINELGYKKTVIAAGNKEFFSIVPFKNLKRGDPVVFRYPQNPRQFFIKRIVGLSGERVDIRNGKVTICNEEHPGGFVLNENEYIPNHVKTKGNEEFELGSNEYVVLGDNRSHSSDSRTWGTLSGDFIVGKVLLRAWPISEFELF